MLKIDKLKFVIDNNQISINKNCFNKTIEIDNSVKYNADKIFLEQKMGINAIASDDFATYITVSGKIMADKNYLGYITKDNFSCFLDRLNSSKLVKIQPIQPKDIKVYICDVTEDIFVSNIDKSILGISEYIKQYSNLYQVFKYDNSGILIKTHAKKCNDSLVIYNKYKELKSHKNREYINTIGYEAFNKCQNTLRIERHLSSFDAIRKAFGIKHKGKIYLDEIFKSGINPIDEKFKQLKLTKEDLNDF